MVVIILCIGASLTVTIRDFLDESDKSYTTTAVFEYMGAMYPDETEYDSHLDESYDLFDSEAIASHPGVKNWDSTEIALGYMEGTEKMNFLAPFRQSAVLVVHVTNYNEGEGVYKGEVREALYSFKDMQDKMVYIDTQGKELELGHYYLFHGEFYLGRSSYTYIRITPFQNAAASSFGFDGMTKEMMEDISSESERYQIPKDSYFYDIAKTYEIINNSLTVQATDNLEALLPFQQGFLYLASGRSFTEEEYQTGSKVCLMSDELAEILKVKLGDQINLSLAVQAGSTINESYWAGKGFHYSDRYTIVGLTNMQNDLKKNIYIPKSNAVDLTENHFTYTIGQAELYNEKASQFYDEINPKLQDRIRLTIYDQGYASTTNSLKDVYWVAILITGVCAMVCMVILLLFGFLFIYRQRDYIKNMHRLGTGRRNIYIYFLFGSGFLSLVSVITGVVISNSIIDQCMELVRHIVAEYTANDLHYSNSGLSMIKTIEFAPEIRTEILFIGGGIIFLLSLCSCCLFTYLSIKPRTHVSKKNRLKDKIASSSLYGGPWKYMWLSIRRGQNRTFIPIIVSACGIVLLFQLTYTMNLYEAKLEALNNNPNLKGYLTDVDGKQTTNLNIDGTVVKDIISSGYLSEANITNSFYYIYDGKLDSSGELIDIPDMLHFDTTFARETFFYKLLQGPSVIFTNNLTTVPEFYYSSGIQIEFLDGYDLSIFKQEVTELPCVIVSTDFMKLHNLQLGDIIMLSIYKDEQYTLSQGMKVVGSYVKEGNLDHIYGQMGFFLPQEVLTKDGDKDDILKYYIFDSFHFRLSSGEVLPELKKYMFDKGYSEVNKIRLLRSFAVIEDKEFLSTKKAMTQRILYTDRIFPALYVLAETVAVLIPFLLIQLRKREIAMMRGQGTSKTRAFFNIFLEQTTLIATGTIIGGLSSMFLFRKFNTFGLILTGIFVGCWLTGAIISLIQINRCSVQSMLKAEE
jgi:ABC-type lipoprotein release transport system permease subunit